MKKFLLPLLLVLLVIGCSATRVSDQSIEAAAENLDYGDYSSQTLVGKAWEAFGKKNYPELFAYTGKVIEMYGEEGKRMNAELTDFEPPETASKKWALNDVGTSLWMRANAYVDLKMFPEPVGTYELLANDYNYSQCWDPKGWFWQPAKGAAARAKQYNHPQ